MDDDEHIAGGWQVAWKSGAVVAGVGLTLWCMLLLAKHELVLGSVEGGWFYFYQEHPLGDGWWIFLLVASIACALTWRTLVMVERWEIAALALWQMAALPLQMLLRAPAQRPLATLVLSVDANSFYAPTLRYSAAEFLRNFMSIAPSLPEHARFNMPGKEMLFFLLGNFTDSPTVLGYLIVAVSNLGAVALYFAIKGLSGDRRTALYAAILYLFIPGRVFFFPLLNTVSPVPFLLSFGLFVRFLVTKKPVWALALGASLYLVLFFDPLPLVAGIVFVAVLIARALDGRLVLADFDRLIIFTTIGLVVSHVGMLIFTGFDVLDALRYQLEGARWFNDVTRRPYRIWVVQNVLDFGFMAGIAIATLALASAIAVGLGHDGNQRTIAAFGLGTLLTLAVLDLTGINRGEVMRLWIWLAVLLPVTPSALLARECHAAWFYLVLSATILQIAMTLEYAGFA